MSDWTREDWWFYRRWIWANGWSEWLGLGNTALLAVAMNRWLSGSAPVVEGIVSLVVLVIIGTLCEGVLVGYAQARVLRKRLPALTIKRWISATALGAGIAWLLGMIPSTLISLNTSEVPQRGSGPPFEGAVVFVAAAAMGIVLGPILGIPQWLQLRKFVPQAAWWIVANSLAWAAGMVVVFVGATAPTENTPISLVILIIGVTCLAAGLIVGAIHGLFLLWLTNLKHAQLKRDNRNLVCQ